MKTFQEIDDKDKRQAVKTISYTIIDDISNGIIDIQLANPESHKALEAILAKSKEDGAPRLASLMILRNKDICFEIKSLAVLVAKDSLYTDNGVLVMERKEDVNTTQH